MLPTMTIQLYAFGPTRSLRAKWALRESGLAFEEVDGKSVMGTDEYKKLHPLGKLPALVHDGKVLFESIAIVNYVGALVPEKKFIPTELYARGLYDQWSCFALAELEAWVWTNAKHTLLYPEEKRVPQILEPNAQEYMKSAAVVDRHLTDRPFILGNDFTFADINIGYCLNWGRCAGLTADFPRVNAYLDRLGARPACVLKDQTEFFASFAKMKK
jgi:glutathione S-transferase